MTLDADPDCSVPVHVLADQILLVQAFVSEGEDPFDVSLRVEHRFVEGISGLDPDVSSGVPREERAERVSDGFQAGMREFLRLQGGQVQQVQSSLGTDPEPVEIVFAEVADEIAFEGGRGCGTERQDIITVPAAEPAARRGDPEESGIVAEDIIDIVAGESGFHIEPVLDIPVHEPLQCFQGKDRGKDDQQDHDVGFCSGLVLLSTISSHLSAIFFKLTDFYVNLKI